MQTTATSTHFEPDASAIAEAQARLAGHALRTPLLENEKLNRLVGARVFIKPENLQRSGSFKLRGALNRALQLSSAERGGAVASAVLLAANIDVQQKTVAVLLSGGNVDAEKFASYIATSV